MLCDRYGRLVLPKGHIMAKETIEHAAKREVAEETGYKHLKIVKALNIENLNYKLHNKSHQKTIHNFLFELEKEEVPHLRLEPQEIYKPVWVRLEDAIKKAFFANTKTLLEDVKRYYDKKETLIEK